MSVILNLGSIILGLAAWAIPVSCIVKKSGSSLPSTFSFTACIVSLLLQIAELRHRVQIEDWSALMDTVGAVMLSAAALAVVTVILNVIALTIFRKPKERR